MKKILRCLLLGHHYTDRSTPPACDRCGRPFYRS